MVVSLFFVLWGSYVVFVESEEGGAVCEMSYENGGFIIDIP